MVHLKNKPAGIDIPIQALQKFLYRKLKDTWAVDDSNFEGYGRVYKNSNDKGYIPELFNSSSEAGNTTYKALYFDKDKLKALFFFSVEDRETYQQEQGTATIPVSVIFIVNLSRLNKNAHHRADEEVRNDVRILCSLGLHETRLLGTETGFQNVFKQFNGLVNKDGEVFEDRHPVFCFKMNLELAYQPAEIKCS